METNHRKLLHHWLIAALPAIVIIAAACGPSLPSTGTSVPSDWSQPNHDLANTRVASGSTISSTNVHRLGVDWTFKVAGASTFGSISTSPLVVGRTVYLQDLKSNVYAIDLDTGKLVWQKQYNAADLGPNGAG